MEHFVECGRYSQVDELVCGLGAAGTPGGGCGLVSGSRRWLEAAQAAEAGRRERRRGVAAPRRGMRARGVSWAPACDAGRGDAGGEALMWLGSAGLVLVKGAACSLCTNEVGTPRPREHAPVRASAPGYGAPGVDSGPWSDYF